MHDGARCQRLNDQRRCHVLAEDLSRGNIPLVLGINRTGFRHDWALSMWLCACSRQLKALSFARASLETPFAGKSRTTLGVANKGEEYMQVDQETRRKLNAYAKRKGKSVTGALNFILEDYLESIGQADITAMPDEAEELEQ